VGVAEKGSIVETIVAPAVAENPNTVNETNAAQRDRRGGVLGMSRLLGSR
jgi:hypothetical protein